MAKQKQTLDQAPKRTALQVQVDQEMKKQQIVVTRERTRENLLAQIDTYLDMLAKRGEQDPMVQLNYGLLETMKVISDLTLQVCDLAESLATVESMLGLMDGSLDIITNFFSESRNFTSSDIRQLRKNIKTFQKSFRNRVKMMHEAIRGVGLIGATTKSMIKQLSKGIPMPKQKPKKLKKGAIPVQSELDKLIAQRRSELTGQPIVDTSTPPTATTSSEPTTPTPFD